MNFRDAVKNIPEIKNCLKDGLQALGRNSNKIKALTKRALVGSVDIDTCLKNVYPNASRWDYVFGYKHKICYVEVHQGKASEVENIVKKFMWLRQWLESSGRNLENLKELSSYHWVSSGRTDPAIRKNIRYQRRLAQNGIRGPSSSLYADSVL
ncbi:hypothetical protein J4G08_19495 [Candidatus Poribacteria bacterium]|nr:hypothetical protein [Candidatus Poribacteria bacterium]